MPQRASGMSQSKSMSGNRIGRIVDEQRTLIPRSAISVFRLARFSTLLLVDGYRHLMSSAIAIRSPYYVLTNVLVVSGVVSWRAAQKVPSLGPILSSMILRLQYWQNKLPGTT